MIHTPDKQSEAIQDVVKVVNRLADASGWVRVGNRRHRMVRVTKKRLYRKVVWMQEQGIDIIIEWAYGQPCCYTTAYRTLSPRLPTGEMLRWLEAYEGGFAAGYDKAEADQTDADREAEEM